MISGFLQFQSCGLPSCLVSMKALNNIWAFGTPVQLAYWSMAKNAFTEDPDVDINDCQHFFNEQAQLFLEQYVSEDRICALSMQGSVGIMAYTALYIS